MNISAEIDNRLMHEGGIFMPQAMKSVMDQYIKEVRNIYGLYLQKIIYLALMQEGIISQIRT